MIVTDYIAKYLIELGVSHVFGFQGGAITKLIDSIVQSGKIEYVQNYHEQASAFSADAYSRITGNIGVAVATNGPGDTNLISGITNAYLDSIPCLFITGQVNTFDMNISGKVRQNGFQEIDIVNIVKPITKYAVTITDGYQIKYELDKAVYIAKSGRPGAVLIDLPLNVQMQEINEDSLYGYLPAESEYIDKSNTYQVNEFISMLKNSQKPVIVAGGGVRTGDATDEIKEFIDLTNIPVAATLMGLDIFTNNNIGFSGIYGNTHTNLAIYNADLLIVLGSRLAKRQLGKLQEQYIHSGKIIHVDIDPHELNHSLKEDLSINSDIKSFLKLINRKIKDQKIKLNIQQWNNTINDWKQRYENNAEINKDCIDPVRKIKEISKFADPNSIICSDVGQNQMWVAQGFALKNGQRILNSGGLGCMGFSLPAAIGAKIAKPDSTVVAFVGDGGLQMNIQEFQLISQRKLGIKCIVFNNSTLGMIKEIQKKYFNEKYFGTGEGYSVPDLALIANAYNINYLKIETYAQLNEIETALKDNLPYLIEVVLNKANTYVLTRYDEDEIYQRELIKDEIYDKDLIRI